MIFWWIVFNPIRVNMISIEPICFNQILAYTNYLPISITPVGSISSTPPKLRELLDGMQQHRASKTRDETWAFSFVEQNFSRVSWQVLNKWTHETVYLSSWNELLVTGFEKDVLNLFKLESAECFPPEQVLPKTSANACAPNWISSAGQ